MREVTKIVVTAYGIAKKYGYTGTEADFAAQLLSGNGVLTIGDGLKLENGVLSLNGVAVGDALNELIENLIDEAVPTTVSDEEVEDMISDVFSEDDEEVSEEDADPGENDNEGE